MHKTNKIINIVLNNMSIDELEIIAELGIEYCINDGKISGIGGEKDE